MPGRPNARRRDAVKKQRKRAGVSANEAKNRVARNRARTSASTLAGVAGVARPTPTIALVGTVGGVGTTTVAGWLADAFAELGKKTLVVARGHMSEWDVIVGRRLGFESHSSEAALAGLPLQWLGPRPGWDVVSLGWFSSSSGVERMNARRTVAPHGDDESSPDYDVIVMDLSMTSSGVLAGALPLADFCLLVTRPHVARRNLERTVEAALGSGREGPRPTVLGSVLTLVPNYDSEDGRRSGGDLVRQTSAVLADGGCPVLEPALPYSDCGEGALCQGRSLRELGDEGDAEAAWLADLIGAHAQRLVRECNI